MSEVILGDCLEVLKKLPDESIDCVITDPPYGDGISYGRGDKEILNNQDESINYEFLKIVCSKMKQDTVCYLFTNWKFEHKIRNFLETNKINGGGFNIRMLLVIVKNNFGMGFGFRNQHELCLVLEKGSPKYNLNNFSTVLKMDNIVHTPDTHPHTKAQNILNQMILHSTKEGDLIFDGFAGSGSIIEACIKTKRNYIAVELDPKWHDLIKQRLEKWTNQQTLF